MRNKFTTPTQPHGESDPAKLQALEEVATGARLSELAERPVEGGFDYDHMKAIHRHVFQDVYEWAGEERVAPVGQFMNKDGHAYYPAGPPLTEAAHAEYAKISAADFLRDLGPGQFVDQLAERWGEVNVIHSFREGNTRTQFAFFSQLAEQAGYEFDAAQFAIGAPLRDEFVQARFHGQDTGNNDRLAAVLRQVVVPLGRSGDDPAVDHDLVKAVRKSREAAGYLESGTQPPKGRPQERAARRPDPSRQSEGYER